MLNFDAWFWHLILTLDFDTWFWRLILIMLDFDTRFWRLILTLDFDAWFWHLILTLDFDSWWLLMTLDDSWCMNWNSIANKRTNGRTTLTLELLRDWKFKLSIFEKIECCHVLDTVASRDADASKTIFKAMNGGKEHLNYGFLLICKIQRTGPC